MLNAEMLHDHELNLHSSKQSFPVRTAESTQPQMAGGRGASWHSGIARRRPEASR